MNINDLFPSSYFFYGGSNVMNYQNDFQNLHRLHILKTYRKIYRSIRVYDDEKNLYYLILFKKAFRYLLDFFKNSRRACDKKIFLKILNVTDITAEKFKVGGKAVTCCLLYELFRLRTISELILEQEFDSEIVDILKNLLKTTNKDNDLRDVLSHFSSSNCLVFLIKAAECLYEMRNLDQYDQNKKDKIVQEVQDLYIPLAHQIGLNTFYLELEDLCLKFNHSIVYDTLVKKLKATKTAPAGFLQDFVNRIARQLETEEINCSIKARTKSISSVCHKLTKRQVPFNLIHDFYAMRIVFDSPLEEEYSKCWSIYETIIELYGSRITNLRDWISYPKESGYEALHITVMSPEGHWVEIQIRAKRMDYNAEHGEAAHWKYKSSSLSSVLQNLDDAWVEDAKRYLETAKNYQPKQIVIDVSQLYVH